MSTQFEEGRYWGKITRQSLGVSKAKKTPQFCISFIVSGKIDLADPQGDLIGCPQAERTVFRVITEKTVEYLMDDLRTLGVSLPSASFRYLDPATPNFVDLAGKECEFLCRHEEYEGKTQERWSVSRGGGQFDIEKLDEKGIKNLDALFGKKLKELAPKTAGRAVATGTTATVAPANGRQAAAVKAAEASWEAHDRRGAKGAEDEVNGPLTPLEREHYAAAGEVDDIPF